MVDEQRIEQLVMHDHARVQGCCRILEDDGDDTSYLLSELGRPLRDVASLEVDMSLRRSLEAAHDIGGRRLAAARLADDADGLAGHELDAHVLHGVHEIRMEQRAGTGLERDRYVIEEDDRRVLVLGHGLGIFCHRYFASLAPARVARYGVSPFSSR
jgi:hypothetical protein